MDINKFIVRFIEKNRNSQTDKILAYFAEHRGEGYLINNCRLFDKAITWAKTDEGFFYFYFLQLRYSILFLKHLYKEGEIGDIRKCFHVARRVLDYCSSYQDDKNGTVSITPTRYNIMRKFYIETFEKYYMLIFEKSC